MKHLLTLALLISSCIAANAQNVQFHYDFGHSIYSDEENGRQPATITLEQFKADRWGSWYYFVDLDISSKDFKGAYTEISREFTIAKSPFAAHVEFDGGLNLGGSFQHALLIGPAYNGHNADYSTTYSVQLMYKQYLKNSNGAKAYSSVQLTGVWSTSFLRKAFTFSGFFDLWRDEDGAGKGQLVFLSEPQLWYNFNTLPGLSDFNLSIGTEVEISNNFIWKVDPTSSKTFFVNPTLALKWTF